MKINRENKTKVAEQCKEVAHWANSVASYIEKYPSQKEANRCFGELFGAIKELKDIMCYGPKK